MDEVAAAQHHNPPPCGSGAACFGRQRRLHHQRRHRRSRALHHPSRFVRTCASAAAGISGRRLGVTACKSTPDVGHRASNDTGLRAANRETKPPDVMVRPVPGSG